MKHSIVDFLDALQRLHRIRGIGGYSAAEALYHHISDTSDDLVLDDGVDLDDYVIDLYDRWTHYRSWDHAEEDLGWEDGDLGNTAVLDLGRDGVLVETP